MNLWRNEENDENWFPEGLEILPSVLLPLISVAILTASMAAVALALRFARRN